jgi:hypothetical protein
VRRPRAGGVIWSSVALFAALFGFLTYQLAGGRDPALGAQATADGSRPAKVRKVIKRRVVTTVVPAPPVSTPTTSAPPVSSAPPVVSAPPVSSVPVAPIVTGAS